MKETDLVEYSKHGHVAIIRLNRPKSMNSMDAMVRAELAVAQSSAESDAEIRVVILTGSGNSFSSGTDLKEANLAAEVDGDNFEISITEYKPLIDAIVDSEKIYLSAINGYVGGVALGLAMGSDLAIMSESAAMSSPFSNVGLVPDGGTSWFLLQSLGYKRAFSAIAECTMLDAQTCLDLGLVNRIVSENELLQAALDWAEELSKKAPLSLKYSKKILRQAATMSLQDTARLESEFQNKCLRSEDSVNAMRAFINKEPPEFIGK